MLARILIPIIFLNLLTGCNVNYEAMAKERIMYAKENQGEIGVAAIQPPNNRSYIKGISLAIEQINQSKKRLLGRPIKLYFEPGFSDFKSAKKIIRRIANNPKISLVLGHTTDEVVLPASEIYEKSQLLFFPPFTTTQKLTAHHSVFTFRMLPDELYMTNQMVNLCKKAKFMKIALLNERTEQYRTLGLLLKQKVAEHNLDLVFSHLIFKSTDDYRSLLSDLKEKHFDAVLLATSTKTAIRLIKQMRELGIDKPIIGTNDLNPQNLKASVGTHENRTIIPTSYNIFFNNTINKAFIDHYKAKYNSLPDAFAAQGYDSIMLFANKVERAKSTKPTLLASTIRFSPQWTGTTGVYHFNKKGNLIGRNYSFRLLNNGVWHTLSAPYLDLYLNP